MKASAIIRRYPDKSEGVAVVLKVTPVRGTKKRPFSMKTMNFDSKGRFYSPDCRLFDFLKIDYYRPIKVMFSTQRFPRSVPVTVHYGQKKLRSHFGEYRAANFGMGTASGPCIPWLEWMLGITIHNGLVVYIRASRVPYKKGK